MIHLIALVLVLWLPGNVASADDKLWDLIERDDWSWVQDRLDEFRVKSGDLQRYGNCIVKYENNEELLLRDPKEVWMNCDDDDAWTSGKYFSLFCDSDSVSVWLNVGEPINLQPTGTVPVKYRFDSEAVHSEEWEHSDTFAYNYTEGTFDVFLYSLYFAETLVFEIDGSPRVRISMPLGTETIETMNPATKDFDNRCWQIRN